jgi:hypothetical protein
LKQGDPHARSRSQLEDLRLTTDQFSMAQDSCEISAKVMLDWGTVEDV